jgi:hypothetical protein
MSLIDQLVESAVKLAPEVIEELVKLVEEAVSSDDPMRVVKRQTEADAAHLAAQEAAREALKR